MDLQDAVGAIQRQSPSEGVKLRQGTVSSVGTGTVTVTIAGSSTAVTLKHMAWYAPVAGDVVWVVVREGRYEFVLGKLTPDTWTAVTFSGSWVNYGSPYYNAAYFKDAMGFVHLRGRVHVSGSVITTDSNIFTLPTGYRPAAEMVFAVQGSGPTTSFVKIVATGVVTMLAPGPEPLFLDGIHFYAK